MLRPASIPHQFSRGTSKIARKFSFKAGNPPKEVAAKRRLSKSKRKPVIVFRKSPSGWRLCAKEGKLCSFAGPAVVRYGARGKYLSIKVSGGTPCTNARFGDPLKGVKKQCWFKRLGKPKHGKEYKVSKRFRRNVAALKAFCLAAHLRMAASKASKQASLGSFLYLFGKKAKKKKMSALKEYVALFKTYWRYFPKSQTGIAKYMLRHLDKSLKGRAAGVLSFKGLGKHKKVSVDYHAFGLKAMPAYMRAWRTSQWEYKKSMKLVVV